MQMDVLKASETVDDPREGKIALDWEHHWIQAATLQAEFLGFIIGYADVPSRYDMIFRYVSDGGNIIYAKFKKIDDGKVEVRDSVVFLLNPGD